MRALHLFFRLHRPYEIKAPENFDQGYFGGEAEFREAVTKEYQPFFALIERNTQRHANLKISLAVSGPWLEQAEKWSPELIRRLRKLVELGRIEILAQPYDHSLSAFYDKAEFAAQVEQFQKKVAILLGAECLSLCLPELVYHDKIAKWADERGFRVVLAGDADRILDWRSVNYLYEVPGCETTRVIFQNTMLSRAVRLGRQMVMTEGVRKKVEAEAQAELDEEVHTPKSKLTAAEFVRGMSGASKKPAQALKVARSGAEEIETDGVWNFSAKKLQKQLDMACMRGNLVNLCLDTGIFRYYREQGVVGMFDELFSNWLKVPGNRFVTASETVDLQKPRAVMSVKTTVNWRGEAKRQDEAGLVAAKDVRYCPPDWLRSAEQVKMQRDLYGLRTAVLSSNDDKLRTDFGLLTEMDYLLLFENAAPAVVAEERNVLAVSTLENLQAALADFRERVPILKLPETAETERKTADKKNETDSELAIKKTASEQQIAPEPEEEDHSVVVHRVRREELPEVDEVEEADEEELVDPDELEMDEWQEAVSDAADDAEAELQIMMQRMSRSRENTSEIELEELVEAEVVAPEEPKEKSHGKKRSKRKIVLE